MRCFRAVLHLAYFQMKTSVLVLQLVVLASLTQCLFAQTLKETVAIYFDSVRAGVRTEMPSLGEGASTDVIKPYLTDTSEVVRLSARELLYGWASASISRTLRAKAIERLLAATPPGDVTCTGVIIPMLRTFEKGVYSDSAKMHIRRLLKAEGPYLPEWMKFAGFLELKDLDDEIRPYAQPGNLQSLRWSAMLSLARMGDERAAHEVLSRVRKLKVNDDVIYKIFPDLVFTRNDAAIRYMIDVLQDDAHQCLSADVEKETTIACGFRIMEQLAPVVEGFPVSLDDSGDLAVDNYASALHAVRRWFIANREYSILRDRY